MVWYGMVWYGHGYGMVWYGNLVIHGIFLFPIHSCDKTISTREKIFSKRDRNVELYEPTKTIGTRQDTT